MNQKVIKKLFSIIFVLSVFFVFSNFIVRAADYSDVRTTPLSDVVNVVKRAFNVLIAASGVIFAIYIIYAAVKLSLSYGDPEGFNQAKYSLLYSLIGYIIILGFFLLVRLVLNLFGSNAGSTPDDPFSKLMEGLNSFNQYIYK